MNLKMSAIFSKPQCNNADFLTILSPHIMMVYDYQHVLFLNLVS